MRKLCFYVILLIVFSSCSILHRSSGCGPRTKYNQTYHPTNRYGQNRHFVRFQKKHHLGLFASKHRIVKSSRKDTWKASYNRTKQGYRVNPVFATINTPTGPITKPLYNANQAGFGFNPFLFLHKRSRRVGSCPICPAYPY